MKELLDGYAKKQQSETAILDFFCHQFELYSSLCTGRHNDAISYFAQQISFNTIMVFVTDSRFPDELRAVFCKFLNNLYVDRPPRERVNMNLTTIKWKNIPEKFMKGGCLKASQSEFADVQKFIEQYLNNLTLNEKTFVEMVSISHIERMNVLQGADTQQLLANEHANQFPLRCFRQIRSLLSKLHACYTRPCCLNSMI